MIRQELVDTDYQFTTVYIYNRPTDPKIEIRCMYDGKKLLELKGSIVRITNEDTSIKLMQSNNQSYIDIHCHICKTSYKLLIYNFDH
jgi:phage FluMu protein Com